MKNWQIILLLALLLFLKTKKKPKEKMNFNLRTEEQKRNFEIAQKFLSERFSPLLVDIALKQLNAESRFITRAKSPAGAMGIAQFMPATWIDFGEGDPYNVLDSLRAYVRFMEMLFKRFPNRPDIALAAYNWGQNRQVLKKAFENNENWQTLKNKLPKETRNYVEKILMK